MFRLRISFFVFFLLSCIITVKSRKNAYGHVLLYYERFSLSFDPLLFTLSISVSKTCPEIDRLILFVSKKGIQDFNPDFSLEDYNYNKLPSCLFCCSQPSCLSLHSCIFKRSPIFKGFSELIALEFHEVLGF